MSRLALALLSLAAAIVNALALTFGIERWMRLDQVVAASAAGLLSLVVPALAISLFERRDARQGGRYWASFAVAHLLGSAAVVALVVAGSLSAREDLLDTALRLRARAFSAPAAPPGPPPVPAPPPRAEAAPAAMPPQAPTSPMAAAPDPPGEYAYQYEEGGVVHFVGTLEEVPPALRAKAGRIRFEPSRPSPRPEPAPAEDPASTHEDDGTSTPLQLAVLAELNQERRRAGLPDVPLDTTLSRGCQLHALYLAQNYGHPSTLGSRQHEEDPELPGYSEEGARAAAASNIAHGNQQSSVALWMATIYHRTLLLDPRLDRVGIGLAEVPQSALHLGEGVRAGQVMATVMHVASRGRAPVSAVAYPGDGQEDVPLRFAPEEWPSPLALDPDGVAGFPVSVDFYRSDGAPPRVTGVRAELLDARGVDIPCHLTTPERPLVSGYGERTIGLIPESPLVASAEYRARVDAVVDGEKWSRSWSFHTARAP